MNETSGAGVAKAGAAPQSRSQADDELLRAVEARVNDADCDVDWLLGKYDFLTADVLNVLGRIGPVTAWVLALREHRKRVENDTGSPLPDQSAWGWKDNNHVG